VADSPPARDALDHMGKSTMQDVVGAAGTPAKGIAPRHPLMHRTRTLDYAIIMSGEIDMLVDEGEVHLKAGDVVVQQATNHAWVNRGTQPCRIAFILLDGQEP
jgi:mannose-6-phosphate isomerase-like protein (cupin superfamily)